MTYIFAVLASISILLLSGAGSVQEAQNSSLIVQHRQLLRSDADILIVTLLDGRVVALDHGNGQVLWSFDSGAPLVSAKQTVLSQGMNVFPGTDGGLYAYHGMNHLSPGLERLSISLPELVDAAPSLTADGSIITGRRESKVFLLDKRTGHPISTISNAADALEDHSGALGLATGISREHLLLLGRQDYAVRSVRVDSKAETWNATFSRIFMMTGDGGSIKEFLQHGAASVLGGGHKPAGLPQLVVGSDNSLQAFDVRTRHRKWYIAFDTPPVSAYRQDGTGGNCLDPAAAAATEHHHGSGLLPLSSSSLLPGKLRGQLAGGTTVLVGALQGSLYALPADHLMLAADGEAVGHGALVWPSRVGSMPLDINPADTTGVCDAPLGAVPAQQPGSSGRLPHLLPGQQLSGANPDSCGAGGNVEAAAIAKDGSSCSPSTVALVDDSGRIGGVHSLVALEPSSSEVLLDELGSLTCPQPPLGIHAISRQQPQVVTWLPEVLEAAAATSRSRQQRQSSRWSLRVFLTSIIVLLLVPLLFRWRAGHTSSSSEALTVTAPQQEASVSISSSMAASAKKNKSKHRKKSTAAMAAIIADSAITKGSTSILNGPGVTEKQDHVSVGYGQQQHVQQQQLEGPLSAGSSPESGAVLVPTVPSSPSTALSLDLAADTPMAASGGGTVVSEGGAGATQLSGQSYVDDAGAVVIGRLRVGPGILGYGSAGTVVYDGVLDSRPVAVKRLLRQFYNLARKEIQVLVLSDEHPNVVRCFAMEEDREFVYLALERCKTSLSETMVSSEGLTAMQDPGSGCPTPWCLAVLSDIAAGLAALHARQIVHRDLKPHNVLLTEAGRAKLSDMGLSKQLVSEQSSFESHGSGGSSGWQAPEQLIAKDGGAVRQSRAVDVFSLGCIMFYCLTGGKHPFGEHYERDTNIMKGSCCLTPLAAQPEAVNLVTAMLARSPAARPSMPAVLGHPFWWSDEQKLQFLVDVSDRVENEDREPDPSLLNSLEGYTSAAVGANWGAGLDAELIANLGKYRRYDYTCLRDLLRVVRNKRNHFREMPDNLQQLLGPVPEGYYRYFSSRFPRLLLGVFFFALKHLEQDPNLTKYWAVGQHQYVPFNKPWEIAAAAAARSASCRPGRGSGARRTSGSGLSRLSASPLPPAAPTPPATPARVPAAAAAAATQVLSAPPPGAAPPIISFASVVLTGPGATASATVPAASSSTEGSTGSSSGSAAAAVSQPGSEVADPGGPPVVGYIVAEGDEQLHWPSFPSRPGKQVCDFFMKTGHCKYGTECVFDHPLEYAVQLTDQGLPFRSGQPICTFYQKTQHCKFGPSCKFHHPKLTPIYAGSALSLHN